MPFLILAAVFGGLYFITKSSSSAAPSPRTPRTPAAPTPGRVVTNGTRPDLAPSGSLVSPVLNFKSGAPGVFAPAQPAESPLPPGAYMPTTPDCPNVGLPIAGSDKGLSGVPIEVRSIYEEPLGVDIASVPEFVKDFALETWRNLARQLECAGYTDAAKALYDKAAQLAAR